MSKLEWRILVTGPGFPVGGALTSGACWQKCMRKRKTWVPLEGGVPPGSANGYNFDVVWVDVNFSQNACFTMRRIKASSFWTANFIFSRCQSIVLHFYTNEITKADCCCSINCFMLELSAHVVNIVWMKRNRAHPQPVKYRIYSNWAPRIEGPPLVYVWPGKIRNVRRTSLKISF